MGRPTRAQRVWAAVAVVGAVTAVGVHDRSQGGPVDDAAERAPARDAPRQVGSLSIPAIDWPNGRPDAGDWESNIWVQAMREFDTQIAVAYNDDNVSGNPDIEVLASLGHIRWWQDDLDRRSRGVGEPERYFFGPQGFEVVEVIEEDFRVTIRGCGWPMAAPIGEFPEVETGPRKGIVIGLYLEWADDGRPVVVGHGSGGRVDGDFQCDTSDARYGLFDPVPARGLSAAPDEEGAP